MGRSYQEEVTDPMGAVLSSGANKLDAGSLDALVASGYLKVTELSKFAQPKGPIPIGPLFSLDKLTIVQDRSGLYAVHVGNVRKNKRVQAVPRISVELYRGVNDPIGVSLDYSEGTHYRSLDIEEDTVYIQAVLTYNGIKYSTPLYGPYLLDNNTPRYAAGVSTGLLDGTQVSLVPQFKITVAIPNSTYAKATNVLFSINDSLNNTVYSRLLPGSDISVQIPSNVLKPNNTYTVLLTPIVGVIHGRSSSVLVNTPGKTITSSVICRLLSPKYGTAAAASKNGETIVFYGGESTDNFIDGHSTITYNTKTKVMNSINSAEITEAGLAAVGDNRYMRVGGRYPSTNTVSNACSIFTVSPTDGSVSYIASDSTFPSALYSFAISTIQEGPYMKLYTFGGLDSNNVVKNTVYRNSSPSDSTAFNTIVGNLPIPLYRASAVAISDTTILITGGATLGRVLSDKCWFFDTDYETYTEAPPLLTPTSGHSTVVMNDGRILVVGGFAPVGQPPMDIPSIPTTDVYIYDPIFGKHIILPPLPVPTAVAGVAATDKLYIAGSYVGNNGASDVGSTECREIFI